jgi:hypothetical protein
MNLLLSKPGLKSLFLKNVNINLLETELKDVLNEFKKQGHITPRRKKELS